MYRGLTARTRAASWEFTRRHSPSSWALGGGNCVKRLAQAAEAAQSNQCTVLLSTRQMLPRNYACEVVVCAPARFEIFLGGRQRLRQQPVFQGRPATRSEARVQVRSNGVLGFWFMRVLTTTLALPASALEAGTDVFAHLRVLLAREDRGKVPDAWA